MISDIRDHLTVGHGANVSDETSVGELYDLHDLIWPTCDGTYPRPTTAADAERQGYTVDRHCYPWVAYKGPRFMPDESFPIDTPALRVS